jgi:hypothetical protein
VHVFLFAWSFFVVVVVGVAVVDSCLFTTMQSLEKEIVSIEREIERTHVLLYSCHVPRVLCVSDSLLLCLSYSSWFTLVHMVSVRETGLKVLRRLLIRVCRLSHFVT